MSEAGCGQAVERTPTDVGAAATVEAFDERRPFRPRSRSRRDVSSRRSTCRAARSCKGMGVDDGAAVARGDGAGPQRVRRRRPRQEDRGWSASRWCTAPPAAPRIGIKKNLWAPAGVGRDFDLSPTSLTPLEPFRDYLTIVSNTDVRNAEAFTAPEIGGDHFRSSAVFLTQTHPKQTQGSDVLRRHLARSDLRAEVRPGHADSVDAAVHRERRSGRRLLLRLLVRLHRHDQLGVARTAAADDSRPARGVRSAVRRRRDAGRARASGAPRTSSILDWLGTVGRPAEEGPRRRRSRAAGRLPRRRARDRAPHPEGRGRTTAAASRASCRARRSACPTRSTSTSS